MNYSDFPDLQKDDFCGTRFGDQGQLEVVGWYRDKWQIKQYVVHCALCTLDSELHEGGVYSLAKSAIKLGTLPCGCSIRPKWTQRQNEVRTSRALNKQGYRFVGWTNGYDNIYSKVIADCPVHGSWNTGTANSFITGTVYGCPSCGTEKRASQSRIPVDVYIKRFKATKNYAKGTTFLYLGSNRNHNREWEVTCGSCNEVYPSNTARLSDGCIGCSCFRLKPDEKFIHEFIETGAFSPGTTFARVGVSIPTQNSPDWRWEVTCGTCGDVQIRAAPMLRKGSKTCSCVDIEKHVKEFLATGAYAEGTTFRRNAEKTSYWTATCGNCEEEYTRYVGAFKRGSIGCSCLDLRKPDEAHIEDFRRTGIFHPETTFSRSLRKRGHSAYWDVVCGECGESYTSEGTSLKNYSRGCSCSVNQREGYINLVYSGENPVAVKFGISVVSRRRKREQNNKSAAYHIETLTVFKFPNVQYCRAAEKECKNVLECAILSKEDLPDGWTETTYCYNIEAIEAIYRKHGGIRI